MFNTEPRLRRGYEALKVSIPLGEFPTLVLQQDTAEEETRIDW